jgi:hypothetical protein
MTCRVCGASSERLGDQVSAQAIEYECCRCLMGQVKPQEPQEASEAGEVSTYVPPSNAPDLPSANQAVTDRVSITARHAVGRPRRHPSDKARVREAVRAYRDRKRKMAA